MANKKKVLFALGGSIFCLMAIYLFVLFEGGHVADILPTWDDEGGYYRQLSAMLEYRHPLGYNGYNGGHALIGNFGFHGVFILLPYYFWCKIFGFTYASIAMCNIFMLIVAIFILGCFVEARGWKIFGLIGLIGASLSPMLLYYTTTCMVEAENYFFSIVIVVLVFKLYEKPNKKLLIAAWTLMIFAVLCKVTWAGMILPLAFVSQSREKNIKSRLFVSLILMLVSMGIGYFVFSLFSSPYTSSVLQDYKVVLQDEGMVSGVVNIITSAVNNFILTVQAVCTPNYGIWFKISALIVWAVFIISVITIGLSFWKKRDIIYYLPGYIMLGYVCGTVVMYTGGSVAIRTLYPAALMSIISIMLLYIKERVSLVIGLSVLGCSLVLGVFQKYDMRQFSMAESEQYLKKVNDFYAETLSVEEEADEWCNTVAVYRGDMPHFYYTMVYPAGVANNAYSIIPDNVVEFPLYALATDKKGEWYQFLERNGYEIIGDNKEVILMKGNRKKGN